MAPRGEGWRAAEPEKARDLAAKWDASAKRADGLQVGRDLNGAVGDYDEPFAFTGKIRNVTIELGQR